MKKRRSLVVVERKRTNAQTLDSLSRARFSFFSSLSLSLSLSLITNPSANKSRILTHALSRASKKEKKNLSLLTSSPSLRIVTLWPSPISFLARWRPRKAWPPPFVLAISTESARQTREARRERREAAAAVGRAVVAREEARIV